LSARVLRSDGRASLSPSGGTRRGSSERKLSRKGRRSRRSRPAGCKPHGSVARPAPCVCAPFTICAATLSGTPSSSSLSPHAERRTDQLRDQPSFWRSWEGWAVRVSTFVIGEGYLPKCTDCGRPAHDVFMILDGEVVAACATCASRWPKREPALHLLEFAVAEDHQQRDAAEAAGIPIVPSESRRAVQTRQAAHVHVAKAPNGKSRNT
jgi:hypothetical protein